MPAGTKRTHTTASGVKAEAPDAKVRTEALEIQGGGNCGNALTAVARTYISALLDARVLSDRNFWHVYAMAGAVHGWSEPLPI